MKTRILRRHYEEKFKRRCRANLRNRYSQEFEKLAGDPKFIGKLARTRKYCSCFMCGNPRKYFNEKTMRERRQAEAN